MDFYRTIINSKKINVNLPSNLKNKIVEIIVLPVNREHEKNNISELDEVCGSLSKYADIDKIPLEKEAWTEAMKLKHEKN
jgi:hypothetical protein